MDLFPDKMPEAEVSIRLAHHLVESGLVEIGIDGAQVRTGEHVHFVVEEFLAALGWEKTEASEQWQADYRHRTHTAGLRVHSKSGVGDVVASLTNGRRLLVEAKKGPLGRSKSSQEYPLLREALGQFVTTAEIKEQDILAVVVPHSDKFAELATRWREAPLVRAIGIQILTVDRESIVEGLSTATIRLSRVAL